MALFSMISRNILPVIFYLLCIFVLVGTACQPTSPSKEAEASPSQASLAQNPASVITKADTGKLRLGAEQIDVYLPRIEGKKIGLVVNQTSQVGNTHLVDTLLRRGVEVVRVFAPEHGFRGQADAGEYVKDAVDIQTGIPIISLYGANKKPQAQDLADLDYVMFDIQDVGTRFYTYISTMHYMMEACQTQGVPMMVLDRPNPNGSYVDGPVLDLRFQSFVGLHPIPIVHGCTVGELAQMILGENWIKASENWEIEVIPMRNYSHAMPYSLPIKPSPNLPNDLSISLYPSLCLFEGTAISVGRGTEFPFQVLGAPFPPLGKFQFTPRSIPGMAKNPKYLGKLCYGEDFREEKPTYQFRLDYLLKYYQAYPQKSQFFSANQYIRLLAGTDQLQTQVEAGWTEAQIRATWEDGLSKYRKIREKYRLYPD